jgi:hypothetical protein
MEYVGGAAVNMAAEVRESMGVGLVGDVNESDEKQETCLYP